VLTYLRTAEWARSGRATGARDVRLVAINFTERPARIGMPPGNWRVEITTVRPRSNEGQIVSGGLALAADEAIVFRPA
jgi:hypothetical protein